MSITLKQIAQEANTSVATVSMVLRDRPVRCMPETAALIKQIAAKHDYIPNYSAVSLKKKATNTIGIIIPDIENLFFSRIIKLLSALFKQDGYTLLFCDEDEDRLIKKGHIDFLKSKNVDAMVIMPALKDEAHAAEIASCVNALAMPHIILDAYDPAFACESVEVDNRLGAELATEYLVSHGHKRIACITGSRTRHSTVERLNGFKEVVSRHGLRVCEEDIYEGDYTFATGYRIAKELLTREITAIFAFNDMTAYGVMQAANEMQIRIPEDISLVGFDNTMFSSMTAVPLTTVSQSEELIAEKVYEKIMGMLRGEKQSAGTCNKVEPKLVIRDSVKTLED